MSAARFVEVMLESLSPFFCYQLMMPAPSPKVDAAGRAIARDRVESFVDQIGPQIAAQSALWRERRRRKR